MVVDTDLPDEMQLYLARVLRDVANDRGCEPNDLSLGVALALKNYGLLCRGIGDAEGYERAHAEVTVRMPVGVLGG